MPKTKNPIAMRKATTFTRTSRVMMRRRRRPRQSSARARSGAGCRPPTRGAGGRVSRRAARARRSPPCCAPTRRRRGGRCPRARRGRGARARSRRSTIDPPDTRTAWSTTCLAVSVARTLIPTSFANQRDPWSTSSSRSWATASSCGSSASCAIAASAMRQRMSGSCDSGAPSRLHRGAPVRGGDGEVERARPDAGVDGGEQQFEAREDAEDERVRVRAGVEPPHDPVGGGERAVEHGRAALAGAHADRVPVVQDADVGVLPVDEPVHDLRGIRRRRVESHRAEPRPRGGERGEDLATRVAVAAAVLRFGGRARAEEHEVVAGLADAEAEDLPGAGLAEDEVEAVVAAVAQDLRDPRPHEVHVHGECGGRGGAGEPHLRAHRVVEAPAEAAELGRHERREVSRLAQLREVLGEERVVAVVPGGALAHPLQEVVVQQGLRRRAHDARLRPRVLVVRVVRGARRGPRARRFGRCRRGRRRRRRGRSLRAAAAWRAARSRRPPRW